MTVTTGDVSPGNGLTGLIGRYAVPSTAAALRSRTAATVATTANGGATTAATSAAAASAGATTTASGGGTSVSASDFLQLLVSELQNQDPTQPTDPNQYIQQLVGVNSLQELIQINQTLSGATASTTTSGVSAMQPAITANTQAAQLAAAAL